MTEEEFDEAQAFWTEKDKNSSKMAEKDVFKWAENFLESHKVLALATASGEFVRCTPLEYIWLNNALWIFSEGGLKFKALKNNKNVCASIFETNTSFSGLKSLQITGKAELVEPFSNEYLAVAEKRNIPAEALRKLSSPMWLIKIIPEEIICLNSDFKKDGFSSRQIIKKS